MLCNVSSITSMNAIGHMSLKWINQFHLSNWNKHENRLNKSVQSESMYKIPQLYVEVDVWITKTTSKKIYYSGWYGHTRSSLIVAIQKGCINFFSFRMTLLIFPVHVLSLNLQNIHFIIPLALNSLLRLGWINVLITWDELDHTQLIWL